MTNLISLDNRGYLHISGPQAKQFLQGQLTCDLNSIDQQTTSLGAHCNIKGRISSLFRIYTKDNSYLLAMHSNLLELAQHALNRYAKFSKVNIEVNNTITSIGLEGDNAIKILENLGFEIPLETGKFNDNGIIRILRHPGAIPRFEIISDKQTIGNLFQSLEKTFKTKQSNYWDLLDINAGVSFLTPETFEKFLPHELNLPKLGAVSFNKGCYLGQEIIARMEHLGKLKKHLVQIDLNNSQNIKPADKILGNSTEIVCLAPKDDKLLSALAIQTNGKTND